MECDEKEFGCLCKNVGGHFPCLFHGLNVNWAWVTVNTENLLRHIHFIVIHMSSQIQCKVKNY